MYGTMSYYTIAFFVKLCFQLDKGLIIFVEHEYYWYKKKKSQDTLSMMTPILVAQKN